MFLFLVVVFEMSLLRYFKPTSSTGLFDPRSSLSQVIPARAIEADNTEVKEASEPRKLGPCNHFTLEQRTQIGKYACENGVVAASRHFSKQLESSLNESTVRGIKAGYLKELARKRRAEEDPTIEVLPTAKRGRPLLLGSDIDKMVQKYLRKLREGGGAVSARIAISALRVFFWSVIKQNWMSTGVLLH